MSHSIFNVFGETAMQEQLAPSKENIQTQYSRPLKGKSAGIGVSNPFQKRVLGDLGNKIANQQPASAIKKGSNNLATEQQMGKGLKELGNCNNTPRNKPFVSAVQKSSTKSTPLQLISKDEIFRNITNTPQRKERCNSLQMKTPVSVKVKLLATPQHTKESEINYSDEPEIFPEDSSDIFYDDIPESRRVTTEDFDKLFNFMRASFRLTESTIDPESELEHENTLIEEPIFPDDIGMPPPSETSDGYTVTDVMDLAVD